MKTSNKGWEILLIRTRFFFTSTTGKNSSITSVSITNDSFFPWNGYIEIPWAKIIDFFSFGAVSMMLQQVNFVDVRDTVEGEKGSYLVPFYSTQPFFMNLCFICCCNTFLIFSKFGMDKKREPNFRSKTVKKLLKLIKIFFFSEIFCKLSLGLIV